MRYSLIAYMEIYFKIISKKVPYEELDITQVVLAVCSGKRPTLPSETPAPLVDLIKKCWDANPENRPGIFISFLLIRLEFNDIYEELCAIAKAD